MRWIVRLSLIAAGVGIVMYGLLMMHGGIFSYRNGWRETNYSAGIVATGIFIGLLAFLPPAAWVNRWLGRKKISIPHDHPTRHHKHHGSE